MHLVVKCHLSQSSFSALRLRLLTQLLERHPHNASLHIAVAEGSSKAPQTFRTVKIGLLILPSNKKRYMYKKFVSEIAEQAYSKKFCDVRAMYLQIHQRSAKYVGAVTRKVCH